MALSGLQTQSAKRLSDAAASLLATEVDSTKLESRGVCCTRNSCPFSVGAPPMARIWVCMAIQSDSMPLWAQDVRAYVEARSYEDPLVTQAVELTARRPGPSGPSVAVSN